MRHIGEAIFTCVLLALLYLLHGCTIRVEVPPWPEGGVVYVPPVQVPCVENVDAGWVCRWPDGAPQ